uniref:non-specific serine/threonine protein kinase n=1 Tax=Lactuca sativa TaxID=4236 RepID=A0A9R1V6M4_LACSA|nr:hypothetical protein LSAT_V11C600300250 [Lactuca sativa]
MFYKPKELESIVINKFGKTFCLFLLYFIIKSQNHYLTLLSVVGHPTLSWIMRVQIALDIARGLEYTHEHTKPHYVHRDIKSSNILLDAFKVKISDFGLAKLVGITNDGEASARVVGTFGYLAQG